MEDLGSARDCSFVYQSENLSHQHIKSLCDYLSQLHNLEISLEKKKYFQNAQMRKLNHQHMFIIPLQQNNGVDLDAITPGLQKASMDLLENSEYQELVQQLGEDYLKDGETLLHGDFYPGSWLEKDGQVKVIDPEFCFCGPAEFDVGIFLAHFFLSDQDSSLVNRFWDQYQAPVAFSQEISMRYAGVEIMRRLLGVAQLPIQHGLEKKKELLELSVVLVSCPDSYTNSGEN
jgi:5-methylthioribose kinase